MPDRRVPNQHTCSDKACQRKRKNRNQARYRARDPVIRESDRDSNRKLKARDPDYYRRWRQAHEEYVKRNREQQIERNRRRRKAQKEKACRDREEPKEKVIVRENERIANVTAISAYLVLNEELKCSLLNGMEEIVKVDLILRQVKQNEEDRYALSEDCKGSRDGMEVSHGLR